MEQDFLFKMGINPEMIKDPMDYLREYKSNQQKSEERNRDPNINDADIFENKEPKWVPGEGESHIRHEKFLKSIGVNTDILSIAQINQINNIRDPKSLSGEESTAFFKSLGVNIQKLVNVMRERLSNTDKDDERFDICTKIGRNDKCPCKSGKKFKKCCEKNDNDMYTI